MKTISFGKLFLMIHHNKIYANKILDVLIRYKWKYYIKRVYFTEAFFYLIFFLLFSANFISIYPNRLSNDTDSNSYRIISMVFDILDLIYFIYYGYRELKQIKSKKLGYLCEFWNFIDLFVILGVFTSIILDFIYMSIKIDDFPLKIVVAVTLLSLWLRLLSYLRGFEGSGFLIQLVRQTAMVMGYFLISIFLLLLGFGSSAFMLQEDFSSGPFFVFNMVYRLILGDYTKYDIYDQDNRESIPLWIGMVIFTVSLSIIMLNLLISILLIRF